MSDLNTLLDQWEPMLRKVAKAKADMEANFYYITYRGAYEAACVEKDSLAARIDAASEGGAK